MHVERVGVVASLQQYLQCSWNDGAARGARAGSNAPEQYPHDRCQRLSAELEDDSDRFFDWGGWAPLAGAAEGQREGEAMPSGT